MDYSKDGQAPYFPLYAYLLRMNVNVASFAVALKAIEMASGPPLAVQRASKQAHWIKTFQLKKKKTRRHGGGDHSHAAHRAPAVLCRRSSLGWGSRGGVICMVRFVSLLLMILMSHSDLHGSLAGT